MPEQIDIWFGIEVVDKFPLYFIVDSSKNDASSAMYSKFFGLQQSIQYIQEYEVPNF